ERDAGLSGKGQISVYVVRQGDILSSIAKMFGVSTNTITWANDIKSGRISPGQELVILPISGIRHTVVKGDTLQSVAKKYKADLGDILSYNSLSSGAKLSIGQVVIVPDGEPVSSAGSASTGSSSSGGSSNSCGLKVSTYERLLVNPCKYPVYTGYYIRPLAGGTKTQTLHGYNAIDFGASVGTPVVASADGTVIISKNGGYNGGYGTYVVISHDNGTQTLYGHMSQDHVTVGQHVSQGEIIGALGNTGKSTGPHVHFEVRGARNPF
ncbi:peptidoglycan DD-metalloendopeptidase family protein, partial [Candidatus Parcubacteria bacterium]|nr:peptidoglycan DD-metalloendopeptidase family protein [Candidatus Parcubacteria bacterium]